MIKVKAVIFDLDDTLISEGQYIESGYRHISNLLSKRLNQDEDVLYQKLKRLLKENSKYVFNRLLDEINIPYTNDEILDLVNEYRNHIPNIKFFHDVFPCLATLNKQNIKLGIITDGYAYSQKQKINAIGAFDYFKEIVVTDDLGREYWKPHPKPFEIIKDKLKVEFEEMVYVGDNPEKDFYIGNTLPIKTIRIYREGIYRNSCYYENIKEDYSIKDLSELNKVINDISSSI